MSISQLSFETTFQSYCAFLGVLIRKFTMLSFKCGRVVNSDLAVGEGGAVDNPEWVKLNDSEKEIKCRKERDCVIIITL